ncbi:MAG: NAD(P)-dependent oxidoreductase, partial [Acidobacteriota bacterium]|nr:NAD(P)-dependent oxidoreductase [Acidobacteriota bacterium]
FDPDTWRARSTAGGKTMKKVLVTGASGRIGRHVVPLLLENGYQVRVAVHSTALPASWAHEVESVASDAAISEVIGDTDSIIHLAGIMPPASDDEVFRTNIERTYLLLQAAAARPRKPRVIFASSDATYCTGWSLTGYSQPIEEDATEQRPTVFYGLSKVVGERLCVFYNEIRKVPIVRLRFVWTLEPAEILDLFTTAPYKEFLIKEDAGNWSKPGVISTPLEEDGTPFTEHTCDVRDAAQAVLGALRSDTAPGHAINVAGPASFRYVDVAPQVARRMNGEAVQARCAGIHSYVINIEKARRLLDFRPRYKVEDSLEDAFRTAWPVSSAPILSPI